MHRFLFLLLHVNAIDWLLNPANYMTTINQKLGIEFGVMWGGAYKLNYETREDLADFSFLYADPGKFYIQKIPDKEHNINIMQKFRIDQNSWIMELEGQHIGRSVYDKEGKFVNFIFYLATKNGDIVRTDNGWAVNGLELEFKVNSDEDYAQHVKGVSVENLDDKL